MGAAHSAPAPRRPARRERPADRATSPRKATYADLLRFVQRRAGPSPAEDVVADAFMVVWRRLDELMDASGAGVQVDVTFRDGTTATGRLTL